MRERVAGVERRGSRTVVGVARGCTAVGEVDGRGGLEDNPLPVDGLGVRGLGLGTHRIVRCALPTPLSRRLTDDDVLTLGWSWIEGHVHVGQIVVLLEEALGFSLALIGLGVELGFGGRNMS